MKNGGKVRPRGYIGVDKAVYGQFYPRYKSELKNIIRPGSCLEELQKTIKTRLDLENFNFNLKITDNGFTIIIKRFNGTISL